MASVSKRSSTGSRDKNVTDYSQPSNFLRTKITRVRGYRVFLPFRETLKPRFRDPIEGFDAVVVEITAADGTCGWGEMAPLGSFYSPAFSAGARAGVTEILPRLLGVSPLRLGEISRLLDHHLNGHCYIKSAIDMACHDLAARLIGAPLNVLLGGQQGRNVPLYESVMDGTASQMTKSALAIIAEGRQRVQVKLRGDPVEAAEKLDAVVTAVPPGAIVFGDANGSWSVFEARRFAAAAKGISFTLEQPCRDIDDCLAIRRIIDVPMVLDESVTSISDILTIKNLGVADGVTLKLSRLGGVGPTRLLRDFAANLGLMVTIEDTGGAELATAAIAHIANSFPEERRLHASSPADWVSRGIAREPVPVAEGRLTIPNGNGLGIEIQRELLGPPFIEATQ
jgi:L-alanine-DL-glutamate epimerase-like enolase superfamily enzyme